MKAWAAVVVRSTTSALAEAYGTGLESRIRSMSRADVGVPATLVTMTGHRDVPQACAMLLSFMQHVGRPVSIVIGDDGTLDETDRSLMWLIDDRLEFVQPSVDPATPCAEELATYAREAPLGKKLALLVGLGATSSLPIVYLDTDVLVFDGGGALAQLLNDPISACRYMADDNLTAYDDRFDLGGPSAVNSGFLILPAGMDWAPGLELCRAAIAEPQHFTEQTTVHFAVNAHGGEPLPADRYVLRYDDVRSLRDHANRCGVVARHYVSPIRWKLWIQAFGGYRRAVMALLHRTL